MSNFFIFKDILAKKRNKKVKIIFKIKNICSISVAQKLLKSLGECNNKLQDFLKNPNKNSFFLKEIEPDEIYKLLQKVNTKKARDLNGISSKLIKVSAEKLKEALALIFNMSF